MNSLANENCPFYRRGEHPLARDHVAFEKEFVELANKKGLDMIDMSYHHLYPDRIKGQLRNNTSPLSLLIRTTPDFMCITDGEYYELKTGTSTERLNVEAYPFMVNQIRSRELHIPCTYVYKGAITEDKIVMCESIWIKPHTLVIPKDEKNNDIRETLINYYEGNCPIIEREKSKIFSNDAYVIIDSEQVRTWADVNEYWEK